VDIKKIAKLLKEKISEITEISDNIIMFSLDGFNFAIMTDEDDNNIVRFVIPNFIDLDGFDADGVSLAYRTTKNVKSAKIVIISNKAWSTIESFYNNEESFVLVFDNCKSALIASVAYFRKEANKVKVDKELNEKAYV
jgi:hypothetical protein